MILPPGAYKKIHCSWNIYDYGWICTWEDYWNNCQKYHQEAIERSWGHYIDLDENEEYRRWLKYYKINKNIRRIQQTLLIARIVQR